MLKSHKKGKSNPLGPRILFPSYYVTTISISMRRKGTIRATISSLEMVQKETSSNYGRQIKDSLNWSEKKLPTLWWISRTHSTQLSSTIDINMELILLLLLAHVWKKPMLAYLSFSHLTLYLSKHWYFFYL